MAISLFLLFFLNLVVSIVVFFYPKAFLHVSAHFTILSCVIVSIYFIEKVKPKIIPHIIAITLGAISGFAFTLLQNQWKSLGFLVFEVLNMGFPGASWLKIFNGWLEKLPTTTTTIGVQVSFLIVFINIALGCYFLWAVIKLIERKNKDIVEVIFSLAFINTFAVGRLYFPWPPLLWGTIIYFGGAMLVGYMCMERKIKDEELVWVAGLGNLPWWLIAIGLGYRILVDPQDLIRKAGELNIGTLGIPIAVFIALLILALWSLINSFGQWLIIKGTQKWFNFLNPKTEQK